MKIYFWQRIAEATHNYHSKGGVVAFASDEKRARELASDVGATIKEDELPTEVRECSGEKECVYIMPDAGCC